MDLAVIASTAVGILSPYLARAAGKAAEAIGEESTQLPGRLYRLLRDKLADKSAASESLADLSTAPNDSDCQAALRRQLVKVMEQDSGLANELSEFIKANVSSDTITTSFSANVYGDGNNVTQQGGKGNVST